MFGCTIITTNSRGIPFLRTSGVNVTTEAVDFALGFRPGVAPLARMTFQIANAIPEGTTGTLPVRFTLNGNTRALTFFGGDPVTAADLAGTGYIDVMYDWYSGALQLMSPLAPAGA